MVNHNIQLSALFNQGDASLQLFKMVISVEIHCRVVFYSEEFQKCVQFLTDPYYLTTIVIK